MEDKTIGVAITSYYYDKFVAQAIDSVLSQTVKPYQIVVVDDASNDTACAIAQKYNVQTIQRHKNLGTRKNFQDILYNVFWTDYCMFLGADNWLHPQYLEKTLKHMKEQDVSIVSTEMYVVGEYVNKVLPKLPTGHIKYKDGYPVWDLYGDGDSAFHHHGSSLFNREHALISGGFYPIIIPQASDYDMWQNMYNRGYKGSKINEPLLYYRQHRFNFSQLRFV